jgi:hypothetical protein
MDIIIQRQNGLARRKKKKKEKEKNEDWGRGGKNSTRTPWYSKPITEGLNNTSDARNFSGPIC